MELLTGGRFRLHLGRRVGQFERLEEVVEVLEVFAAQPVSSLSLGPAPTQQGRAILPRMPEVVALRELETWTAGNILGAVILLAALVVAIVVLVRRYLGS